jgi:hypothetical protein
MGSPQDPRARHRQKARRAKKNAAYDARKAAEASLSTEKKKGAAPVAKSGR